MLLLLGGLVLVAVVACGMALWLVGAYRAADRRQAEWRKQPRVERPAAFVSGGRANGRAGFSAVTDDEIKDEQKVA